jgi:hypothetical protein
MGNGVIPHFNADIVAPHFVGDGGSCAGTEE